MFTTKVLRQAAAHAERTPSIKFIGRRTIPSSIDHSPHPHPASPSGSLPQSWAGYGDSASASNKHQSFSSYRDHAQQHGPLQKTIKRAEEVGIGGMSGHELGPVAPPKGAVFDRSELPVRFRRTPIELAEIEAVESGGAAMFG